MKSYLLLTLSLVFAGCATPKGRVVLDRATDRGRPDWVASTKMSWVEGDSYKFVARHTIRGDERVAGCYQLAQLDTKQVVLSQISDDVRGLIDNAQQSLMEDSESLLSLVRSSKFSGTITGLRMEESYYERYVIGDQERVDCFVLASIEKAQYNITRQRVLHKIVEVDPRLKDAILEKQKAFLTSDQQAGQL
ncbi:MAG: hypothetical protein H6626_01890 [Pseudobdellovibrionaceae bacterium]|nr:hypothetical protein [Bdellovibrionales bacterium]USN47865.1 MAG: hypothetical protein H6626_01890 [Pseudobdellovibrionaceae bacterium]